MNQKGMILKVLFLMSFAANVSADTVSANKGFEIISSINAELIITQCQEDYKLAEAKYSELNNQEQTLIDSAVAQQKVIDQIIERTKSLVEDINSPYGEFVTNYFNGNLQALGMANIRVKKEPRFDLVTGNDVESFMKGVGFALGSESTSDRLSFQFRFFGTCQSNNPQDCKTVPRESYINVRVTKDELGRAVYKYELDKFAEPIKNDSQSVLSQLGFYGSKSAIQAQVFNMYAVEDFIRAHGQDFETFMTGQVGKSCYDFVAGGGTQDSAPHEIKPHEFKPHEEGAAALFSGLSRGIENGSIDRAPASASELAETFDNPLLRGIDSN